MKCLTCGKEEVELTLPDKFSLDTIRRAHICENKRCLMYLNLKELDNWRRARRPLTDI